jgi:hypothetical protein
MSFIMPRHSTKASKPSALTSSITITITTPHTCPFFLLLMPFVKPYDTKPLPSLTLSLSVRSGTVLIPVSSEGARLSDALRLTSEAWLPELTYSNRSNNPRRSHVFVVVQVIREAMSRHKNLKVPIPHARHHHHHHPPHTCLASQVIREAMSRHKNFKVPGATRDTFGRPRKELEGKAALERLDRSRPLVHDSHPPKPTPTVVRQSKASETRAIYTR